MADLTFIEIRDDDWTGEATWTLIYAWGKRYIELNRGNLTQTDWQEVAKTVNALHGHDTKACHTELECKNHIETLKQKYKDEKARVEKSNGQFTSSWPFYSRLNSLITKKPTPPSVETKPQEKRPVPPPVVVEIEDSDEDDDLKLLGTRGGERNEGEEERKKRLTMSTERFVEIYRRVGEERKKQMVQFVKDLGDEGMQLLKNAQIQLDKIKQTKRTRSESDVMMTREDKGTKREKFDELSIPPGFVSLTSFVLKRIERNDKASSSLAFGSDLDSDLEKSLRHRPWILDKQLSNPRQSDMEHLAKNHPIRNSLPKGVIRGCASCNDCQKVTASWHPEESCIPVIEDAPVFLPTEEEFRDTLKYIASIRPQAEQYGICRIVPPPSWQPPCIIKAKNVWETCRFCTRIQQIDELQYLHSKKTLNRINEKIKGKSRTSRMGLEFASTGGCLTDHGNAGVSTFGFDFDHGPEFTPQTFKKYADEFTKQYFHAQFTNTGLGDHSPVFQEQWALPLEKIEGEYWRIVKNPTEEIQVLSGANLDTRVFGSGFPLPSNPLLIRDSAEYMESGWNLNNTAKLSGSLLAFESYDASALSVPRINIGMCFSSICWKVEEHHLYSLQYTHLGAAKVWYGIPGKYILKCEAVLKKAFPELSKYPALFHKLITQLSPSTLKSEGIPVYRCVQYPRQFVLIFPGAYYSGFDCGFNCSETVNFAPFDWLPYGHNSVEVYSELGRKTSISYDKLLMRAAMEVVRALWKLSLVRKESGHKILPCRKDGILAKAVKLRVKRECMKREYLCNSSQSKKMEKDFNLTVKRECSICFYDLYLSATHCPCAPERYSCLVHSKQLCSCPWSSRIFLFRNEISELNVLVDALEGKLSAVFKWAKEHLGLGLQNDVKGT